MVEVACVKAWATNLCNQLKSCTGKVIKCICDSSRYMGIDIGGTCDLSNALFSLLLVVFSESIREAK